MNTKNIFRMLLVAATLLLGANYVKASEKTVKTSYWNNNTNNYIADKSDYSHK
jgi:hypothetical protein